MQTAFATNAVVGVRAVEEIHSTTWDRDRLIVASLCSEYEPLCAGSRRYALDECSRSLMSLVPSGVVLRGRDNGPVWIEAFVIDVHPTTNADYARFIAATGHTSPPHSVRSGRAGAVDR